jgi:hypothetical protein
MSHLDTEESELIIQRVKFVQDNNLYATDFMKAVQAIHDLKERTPEDEVS